MSAFMGPPISNRRLRRVQLAVPGSNERMIQKAAASAADHVFLDLEDAVAPSAKTSARKTVVDALTGLDWGGKTRCVRVNDLTTPWSHEDVIYLVEHAGKHIDTLMIPKIASISDVHFYDTLLRQLELKYGLDDRIGLEVLIEDVQGLQNVESIARASDRVESLIFGVADFSASMGVGVSRLTELSAFAGDIWYYPKFRVALAARAAGVDAIDTPPADFRNEQLYRREAMMNKLLGYAGKWAIHPSQIEIALDVFSPTPAEIAAAQKITVAYEEANRQGLGSISVDGEMIDAASIRILRNVLERAGQIAARR